MFIGREKELRVLENEYNKKGFSMTILYGLLREKRQYFIRQVELELYVI